MVIEIIFNIFFCILKIMSRNTFPEPQPGSALYLDERRGVQGNTSMRSRELPRPNAGIFLYSPTQVKVQTLTNL